MPITTGFNHVATLTTDLDRHVALYARRLRRRDRLRDGGRPTTTPA